MSAASHRVVPPLLWRPPHCSTVTCVFAAMPNRFLSCFKIPQIIAHSGEHWFPDQIFKQSFQITQPGRGKRMHSIVCISGFPGGASGKEPACRCRRHKRHRFDPWVGKIPWRRAQQPTHSSILARKIPWTEEHGGLQSIGPRRVGHDGATEHAPVSPNPDPLMFTPC